MICAVVVAIAVLASAASLETILISQNIFGPGSVDVAGSTSAANHQPSGPRDFLF